MDLVRFDISAAFRQTIEPLILDALFEYAARHRAESADLAAPMHLSLAQALEVLAAQQVRWKEKLGKAAAELHIGTSHMSRKTTAQLYDMLHVAHEFFRREGAHTFRAASEVESAEERFAMLWTDYFSRCLLDWLRDKDLITDPDHLEIADALVEAAKLWTKDLAEFMAGSDEPSDFFHDAEREMQVTLERGPVKLLIRGKPEPLLLRADATGLALREYRLGDPEQVELRIAQALFYMTLLERARGQSIVSSSIAFFRKGAEAEHDSESGQNRVDQSFNTFIGNTATVNRVKQKITASRRQDPPVLTDQWLITGAAGNGKTELGRCIAHALDLPLIELHSASIDSVEDLVRATSESLADQDVKPQISTDNAGHPTWTYPPCVLFFDDAHGLRRRIDWLLPLLGAPRKLASPNGTALFPQTSIIAATTDASKLPEKFRAWFRQIELEPYRVDEIARMVRLAFAQSGLMLDDSLAQLLARMGRCNPLRARLFATELRDRYRAQPGMNPLTRDTAMRLAQTQWKVDEHGLGDRDYQYMKALESGPKGLPSLQQLLPTMSDELLVHIEPYLIQLEAVHRGARGRALTVLGEQMLHRHRGRKSSANGKS